MADEDQKPQESSDAKAMDDKEAKEETPAEAPAKETEPEEKPAAPPTDDEAGSRQEDDGGKKASVEEAPAEEATPEPEPEPEPVSPIDPEMLDTSSHKGKMIGAEGVNPGMTVRVHERIVDISPKGEKRERVQVFEGIVLGLSGGGNKKTFTVRKVSGGIGVEKIFPLSSPNVIKIEVVKIAKVRRAKLSFLKNAKRRFRRKLKESWVK